MKTRNRILAAAVLALAPVWAFAADLTGTWTATYDTQMGPMEYTYQLKQTGAALTGTAKNQMGEVELKNGKVENDSVTFVEEVNFGGMPISISYTGKILPSGEIEFTRKIGDFGTDSANAKRAAAPAKS